MNDQRPKPEQPKDHPSPNAVREPSTTTAPEQPTGSAPKRPEPVSTQPKP
jgi:hypothetical protein